MKDYSEKKLKISLINLFKAKNILLLDGIFLSLIGFGQVVNSFIGYYFNMGLYKILGTIPFAAIGVFETSFLLGLMGLILIRAARKESNQLFLLKIASVIHFFIVTSNIIFWKDTFPINNAEVSGIIISGIHIIIFFIYIYTIMQIKLFRKKQ